MVDDLKKQMRRFENLIGFGGKLDVTSRKSIIELINALSSKYKKDVQSSLRLHRLEFFYDLVENQRRKKEKREEDSISKLKAKHRSPTKKAKEKEEDKSISDEIVKIEAKDIGDWKDLMTLSRIYYVMEHPRSEGLTWKRRIRKKTKIDKFEDMDLIEWRVSQNFRLKGLEEWAQRRSDAHMLAERLGFDFDDIDESDEDSKEMEDLFQMFDPSSRRKWKKESDLEKEKTVVERPFKFSDASVEDWTESYSEDSERSDIEDFTEEIEDLTDDTDTKISDSEDRESPIVSEEEDISELFAVYPEFSIYREPIFMEMDEAKTFADWLELYKKVISQLEEMKENEHVTIFEETLDVIKEEGKDYDEKLLSEEGRYDELLEEKNAREKLIEKQMSEQESIKLDAKETERNLETEEERERKLKERRYHEKLLLEEENIKEKGKLIEKQMSEQEIADTTEGKVKPAAKETERNLDTEEERERKEYIKELEIYGIKDETDDEEKEKEMYAEVSEEKLNIAKTERKTAAEQQDEKTHTERMQDETKVEAIEKRADIVESEKEMGTEEKQIEPGIEEITERTVGMEKEKDTNVEGKKRKSDVEVKARISDIEVKEGKSDYSDSKEKPNGEEEEKKTDVEETGGKLKTSVVDQEHETEEEDEQGIQETEITIFRSGNI